MTPHIVRSSLASFPSKDAAQDAREKSCATAARAGTEDGVQRSMSGTIPRQTPVSSSTRRFDFLNAQLMPRREKGDRRTHHK